MIEQSFLTLLLVAVIFLLSFNGFQRPSLTNRYAFSVDAVQGRKEYHRLLTSGFFHNSWLHLLFNLLALYGFGSMLEGTIGGGKLLLIFFAGLVGGNLLALFVHRLQGSYTAVGASGGVNALVYAAIALFPNMGIGLFLLPLSIPAWAFGLAYVVFTIYGIKARWGNSGHAAHLGGALLGMVIALLFYPQAVVENAVPVLLILVPTVAFLLLLVYKPEWLLLTGSSRPRRTVDQEYNYRKTQQQADIDGILEKIHRKGMKSLTREEREALERYSRTRS